MITGKPKNKPPKLKKCKVCPTKFTPRNSLQIVCCGHCAYLYQKRQSEKKAADKALEDRKAWRERKAKLKPLKHWEDATQRVVNDYVRERDRDEPCISCGRYQAYGWHAGHFRTIAKASQIRYIEDNINKQCSECNTHQSGNITPYRINLVKKIGAQRVEALENNNTPHRYTREELDSIRKLYRAKLRELKKLQEAA
ncbi:recombination protein NinG [Yersinia ruckeri]|uniref:recombination protein NinG n=1 Tax=Yersinia ruckeri TaxID=29486 RepID=UPI0020BFFDE4|nr:recombination protein NinG [Yersinia ruckeri]EKN4696954.1 recombination protein NinG [Yersinia ruckeri]MCK8571329.1 recombination protein NinG [Yersinia ruckeri]MCK8577668.1 recombination protein NinG [Yersinia ruckeri]MCK8581457.1 recombination protein NinG [Yersinia ruckeri]UZX52902.1 recombination protein NinG [Yersinia ruckeri]